jgi:hypothetical protein
MKHTTSYDEKKRICIVRVTGQHRRSQDSLVLQQLARDIGEETGCQRFLFDMTKAEITSSITAAFETGTVPIDTDKKQVRQKIALVYSLITDDHKFMETVAANRGYRLRVFDEKKKALEWLNPKQNNI